MAVIKGCDSRKKLVLIVATANKKLSMSDATKLFPPFSDAETALKNLTACQKQFSDKVTELIVNKVGPIAQNINVHVKELMAMVGHLVSLTEALGTHYTQCQEFSSNKRAEAVTMARKEKAGIDKCMKPFISTGIGQGMRQWFYSKGICDHSEPGARDFTASGIIENPGVRDREWWKVMHWKDDLIASKGPEVFFFCPSTVQCP